MTKDIDQLLKIADGLDNSGLFGASEAVSGVIQHIANKLSSDNYRSFLLLLHSLMLRETLTNQIELRQQQKLC